MKGEAEEAKENGNKCIKEKKYAEALLHYSRALQLDPNNHTTYSNRSLAFKHLDQYHSALEDGNKVVELNPTWHKGYYRIGEVYFATENYKDAIWFYKQALNLCRDDENLQQCVVKAEQHHRHQVKAEKQTPLWGMAFGVLISISILLSDSLLSDSPILTHIVFQVLLVTSLGGLGYGSGYCYRLMMRVQRNSLLEPPFDLYGETKSEVDNNNGSVNNEAEEGGHYSDQFFESTARKRKTASS